MSISPEMRRLLEEAFRLASNIEFGGEEVSTLVARRLSSYDSIRSEEFRGMMQGRIGRVGLHAAQGLIYQSGANPGALAVLAESLPDGDEPNWELIAALEVLAELNLAVARRYMPSEIQSAAERWGESDADDQLELCDLVYQALLTEREQSQADEEADDSMPLWMEDVLDQPVERIFPLEFLGRDSRDPNCFGKGQVLVEFAQMAGARCFGVTPICTSEQFIHPDLERLGELLIEQAKLRDLPLPENFLQAFSKRQGASDAVETVPDRFHMAVIIQLRDGRWCLIDPHMRVFGVLEEAQLEQLARFDPTLAERLRGQQPKDLELVPRLVDVLCPMLPGAAVWVSQGHVAQRFLADGCKAAQEIIDLVFMLYDRWKQFDFVPQGCVSLLSHEGLLKILIENGIGVPADHRENFLSALRGERYLVAKVGEEGEKGPINYRTHTGREISLVERNRLEIAVQILVAFSEEGLELFSGGGEQEGATARSINVGELAPACRRVLGVLFAVAYKKAGRKFYGKGGRTSLVHPVLEVYEPKFRIGVELIAHLNAIGEQSNEVVMELAALCGGQHHLVLAATEAIRTHEDSLSGLAKGAVEALNAAPSVLNSVREGLGDLVRAELLQQEDVVHGEKEEGQEKGPQKQVRGDRTGSEGEKAGSQEAPDENGGTVGRSRLSASGASSNTASRGREAAG